MIPFGILHYFDSKVINNASSLHWPRYLKGFGSKLQIFLKKLPFSAAYVSITVEAIAKRLTVFSVIRYDPITHIFWADDDIEKSIKNDWSKKKRQELNITFSNKRASKAWFIILTLKFLLSIIFFINKYCGTGNRLTLRTFDFCIARLWPTTSESEKIYNLIIYWHFECRKRDPIHWL